jgi:hypothetical protein
MYAKIQIYKHGSSKKKKRYNELKYRGKKKSIIMLEIQKNVYISEQLNKDTKNINLYFSLLGVFFVQGLLSRVLLS